MAEFLRLYFCYVQTPLVFHVFSVPWTTGCGASCRMRSQYHHPHGRRHLAGSDLLEEERVRVQDCVPFEQ